MENRKIIIGSRGSKLAIIYAKRAKTELAKFYNEKYIELKNIVTTGDTVQNIRLSDYGGKGLFSKKIEEELLDKKIDIAVHALKDLPSIETKGLETKVFLERNDPRDVFINLENKSLNDLKSNSVIGTSSFRRVAQLNILRKDLDLKMIRGNVDTRINKLEQKKFNAIVLSYAGIEALGLKNRISQIFSIDEMLPCVGQGVIALQSRVNDKDILNLISKVNDLNTFNCVIAERAMLKTIEGDCDTAVGGLATINNNSITLKTELFSTDGKQKFSAEISGKISEAKKIGIKIGKELIVKAGNSYKK